MMKSINTSIFDFPTLIEAGYVYVDKTVQIYELAKPTADRIYFLSRPRRFGKSLLLSTLKALFQGRRELFRGLAIERTDWDWEHEIYPVLHLDMSTACSRNAELFEQKLSNIIELACTDIDLPYDKAKPASVNFEKLLIALAKQSQSGKLVLLIDDYDAPISRLLDSEAGRKEIPEIRSALHDFYVVAKARCENLRLLMVTGVSRFAKTSIFSAFNNPADLALDARTADLLGYTHEEMETYFHEHIQAFADARGQSYEKAFAELLDWYDSYQFCPNKLVKVINPVSFGNALSNAAIRNYWEATAGSTLIYSALKKRHASPADFTGAISLTALDAADALTAPVSALLYQGGYLTISERINDQRIVLRIPNMEVRNSLQRGYMSEILGTDFELDAFQFTAEDSVEEVAANGVTDTFKGMLQSAYAKLPHDWVCRDEKEAKRYFLAFMVFARADVAGEPQHATGRPDAVLSTAKGIYIFEFKYNASAAEAIRQCHARNYASRFAGETRPVYYVGVDYNPADNVRTVDDIRCEQVMP